jgi:ABC-type antimicrobial peptide transport system permease subunit
MDANTAMYSLHLPGGVGSEFTAHYGPGRAVRFRVAGLLATCVLQGNLVIGEADFLQQFPETSGYRMFLVRAPSGRGPQIAALLEDHWGDQGFDATPADRRLAELLAVQNTYLSTFQTLGALGLLLGTFGLATVQVRNVVERRGELALMRAAGFRPWRLAGMVLIENVNLLLAGLLAGFLASLWALLPYVLLGGASVPLGDLVAMLAMVLAVGILSSLASVRSTLAAPLLPALRGE